LLRVFETVKSFLKVNVKKLLSLGAFGAAVGFLNDGTSLISSASQFFNQEKPPLVVVQSRLKAYRFIRDEAEGQDNVFIQLKVRNYGMNPTFLTSATAELVNSDKAQMGTLPAVHGHCALTSIPNENTPIKIDPGETVWIRISSGFRLPGLSTWFTNERLKVIHVTTPENPMTISETRFIEYLNEHIKALYGSEAAIVVTLHSGNSESLQKFQFRLAGGKDIFANDGSLQHDWFIANWMYPNWGPDGIGAQCKGE
jgi:hypothetical protein